MYSKEVPGQIVHEGIQKLASCHNLICKTLCDRPTHTHTHARTHARTHAPAPGKNKIICSVSIQTILVFFVLTYALGAFIRDARLHNLLRAQELCESPRGRPGLPVPNSPYGLCGRKATLNLNQSLGAV